jgi:ABC-type Mn2+/Zn2+ transport system permease subunit
MIVPAATAMNCTRNLRQLFRWTMVLCVSVCVLGPVLSWNLAMYVQQRQGGGRFELGTPGTIILLCVGCFIASIYVGPWLQGRRQPTT